MNKTLCLLIILILSAPFATFATETSAGTKIKTLFWNIGANRYNPSQEAGPTPLDRSLISIATQDYDVLALSEYVAGNLAVETVQVLSSEFQYKSFFPYTAGSSSGIMVFSKFSFTSITKPIDWVRSNWPAWFKKKYREEATKLYHIKQNFVRDYIRITLNKDETEFNLVLFHFVSPWNGLIESVGKYAAGMIMMFGQYHPVTNQTTQMQERFIQDFGYNSNKNIMMMGDSNCPYKYLGVMSVCYQHLRNILPAVYDANKAPTHPADNSTFDSSSPKVKIDHAFASNNLVSELEVLSDVDGSDHSGLSLVSEVKPVKVKILFPRIKQGTKAIKHWIKNRRKFRKFR